jgi:predicted nucleic acid-binding protein
VRNVLIDAWPLVALFAVDDPHHKRVNALMAAVAKDGVRLLTIWPCVVEAAYLVDPPFRFELLRWIELGGVQVYPFESHHLGDIASWVLRYTEAGKRDMDLADASLYWLAVDTGNADILPTDVADFSRYRLPDGVGFNLI